MQGFTLGMFRLAPFSQFVYTYSTLVLTLRTQRTNAGFNKNVCLAESLEIDLSNLRGLGSPAMASVNWICMAFLLALIKIRFLSKNNINIYIRIYHSDCLKDLDVYTYRLRHFGSTGESK